MNFEDQIKENLENRPEPAYEERLWNKLELDLKNKDGSKEKVFPWKWLVAAMFLFLLGANLFSFLKLKNVEDQMLVLQYRADSIHQTIVRTNTNTIYKTDTIIQTKIIRRDIIKYIQSPIPNSFAFTSQSGQTVNPYYSNEATSGFSYSGRLNPKSIVPNNALTSYLNNKENHLNSNNNTASNISNLSYDLISNLPFLPLHEINGDNTIPIKSTINEVDQAKRKTFRQQLYSMRPKGFQVGLSGGWLKLLNDDLSQAKGRTIGLNANINFSANLQLWASATYGEGSFSSDDFNNATIPPPTQEPPSDEFLLGHASADFSMIQFSTGLQYFFNTNKKIRPLIGLGFATEKQQSYLLEYEFSIEDQGIEWEATDRIPSKITNNLFMLRAGLEYQLTKDWRWLIKADYRKDFRSDNTIGSSLINIHSGINFDF